MSQCTSCGFDWQIPAEDIVPYSAARLPRYRELLSNLVQDAGGVVAARTRPGDGVWSPVEYLAHLRDVASFFAERIDRVLVEDRPVLRVSARFAELAEVRGYRDEDPATVLVQFEERADALQGTLRGLDQHQWSRAGVGSEGDERTTLMLARRFAHEVHHHLLDIEEQVDPSP